MNKPRQSRRLQIIIRGIIMNQLTKQLLFSLSFLFRFTFKSFTSFLLLGRRGFPREGSRVPPTRDMKTTVEEQSSLLTT